MCDFKVCAYSFVIGMSSEIKKFFWTCKMFNALSFTSKLMNLLVTLMNKPKVQNVAYNYGSAFMPKTPLG